MAIGSQASTLQVERDCIFFYNTDTSLYGDYELRDGKISAIPKGDKRLTILDAHSKPTNYTMCYWMPQPTHSYQNGRGIGYGQEYGFVKYEKGQWFTHLGGRHGDINDIWSIDANNFVAVGDQGIVVYRDGKKTHPMVNISGGSYQGPWLCVWGVNMNKYWVMDYKGLVVQVEGDQVRPVVQDDPVMNGVQFRDAWVSPEGTVFAITSNKVYRLE